MNEQQIHDIEIEDQAQAIELTDAELDLVSGGALDADVLVKGSTGGK